MLHLVGVYTICPVVFQIPHAEMAACVAGIFMFIFIADKNKVVRLVSLKCFTSYFWLKPCTELAIHKLHSLYYESSPLRSHFGSESAELQGPYKRDITQENIMTDESAVCNRKFFWGSHRLLNLLVGCGFHDL